MITPFLYFPVAHAVCQHSASTEWAAVQIMSCCLMILRTVVHALDHDPCGIFLGSGSVLSPLSSGSLRFFFAVALAPHSLGPPCEPIP